jgi:uncharacterized membrane protein YeiB
VGNAGGCKKGKGMITPHRASGSRPVASNFWWRALIMVLFGIGLHYLLIFNGYNGNAISTYVITGVYLVFLVVVPVLVVRSRGYVLARTLVLAVWLGYMVFIGRVIYVFIKDD